MNVKTDSEWIEYPILWTALIGNPSQKKTPCLKIVKNILDIYDQIFDDKYLEDNNKYKNEIDTYTFKK
ncbi:DUF3987 domain-containing protein [bacterium]|nr:DUF3987 domain-containing protein [bacterium]